MYTTLSKLLPQPPPPQKKKKNTHMAEPKREIFVLAASYEPECPEKLKNIS